VIQGKRSKKPRVYWGLRKRWLKVQPLWDATASGSRIGVGGDAYVGLITKVNVGADAEVTIDSGALLAVDGDIETLEYNNTAGIHTNYLDVVDGGFLAREGNIAAADFLKTGAGGTGGTEFKLRSSDDSGATAHM
jgi:hypothetical protein